MTPSFWGFGGGSSKAKPDAMIPPTGAFAPATTALTTAHINHDHGARNSANSANSASATANSINAANSANLAASAGATRDVAMNDAPDSSKSPSPAPTATTAPQQMLSGQTQSASQIVMPPTNQQIKGKLRVKIIQAKGLLTSSQHSNPYVVCSCSTSEYISRSMYTSSLDNHLGSGIAIPSNTGSRIGSAQHMKLKSNQAVASQASQANDPANPQWEDEAIFDLTSFDNEVEVNIFDAGDSEKFLGWAKIRPDFSTSQPVKQWYQLHPRLRGVEQVAGQVHVSVMYEQTSQKHYGPGDFEVLRLIGRGTFGQVYQVRKKDTRRVYAMKVLSKRVIVQKKEIAHTLDERNILVRTSGANSHFLVGLKFSFQTAQDLYLVTDYMSGGELFWHLQREGRFSEERARFYIAELILALNHLHDNDIVYRDLKPENILLDAQGHIALCDFGLSKANLHNGTTNTFCGTTEYLAPEVLLDDKGYTKMVDFWSLGVLIFEMCCGWSPFYAEDNQQMYKNIAFGKVRFPKDALSPEGRDFVKGLLNRNPKHRLGAQNDARELMAHPFFNSIDWDLLVKKQIPPPFKPHVSSEEDTSNFDPEFTNASTSVLMRNDIGATPLSPGIQEKFKGFTYVDDVFLNDENFRGRGAGTLATSYRPPPPSMGKDDGVDLYDEKEIELSHSVYDSGIKHKFETRPGQHVTGDLRERYEDDEDMMRMEEVDEEQDRDYDDFVDGQGFEI